MLQNKWAPNREIGWTWNPTGIYNYIYIENRHLYDFLPFGLDNNKAKVKWVRNVLRRLSQNPVSRYWFHRFSISFRHLDNMDTICSWLCWFIWSCSMLSVWTQHWLDLPRCVCPRLRGRPGASLCSPCFASRRSSGSERLLWILRCSFSEPNLSHTLKPTSNHGTLDPFLRAPNMISMSVLEGFD